MRNQKKINLPGKNQKANAKNEKTDREYLEESGINPDELIKEYTEVFDEITAEYNRISRKIDRRKEDSGMIMAGYRQTESRAVCGASFRNLREITEKDVRAMAKDEEKLKELQEIVNKKRKKGRIR